MICGVDEAGRGPLAGPVVAAAVILGARHGITGLDDSKKIPRRRREVLALSIRQHAVNWSIASASVEEIDELNILQATLLAMRRAVEALSVRPSQVLVDGLHCPTGVGPVTAVVRGDSTVAEISAASILAKTERDRLMLGLHTLFPCYGFDRHMGYPTALHLEALRRHGVSNVHRRTFGPVRVLLSRAAT